MILCIAKILICFFTMICLMEIKKINYSYNEFIVILQPIIFIVFLHGYYIEASKSRWINTNYNSYGVNSLGLRGLHIYLMIKIAFLEVRLTFKRRHTHKIFAVSLFNNKKS